MAINVPSDPKVYTTKYDNFKGVDFTNDPSNVWSHRSPNAVNMTPDLAGRPWKRTGWEIIKTSLDFRNCYNSQMGHDDDDPGYYDGKIVPIKTNYFEIGGEDYLAISNNLGLFIYSKFIGTSAKDAADIIYIDRYYGEVGTAEENLATVIGDTVASKTFVSFMPDPNRAFFFEGMGLAGFYIFCTATWDDNGTPVLKTNLFRFDGQVLRLAEAYVPTIMIAKEPGDAPGTIYENPNVLTVKRKCQFMGDGTEKNFVLPEKADETAELKVELMENGAWTVKTLTTHYTVNYSYSWNGQTVTKVTFVNPPPASTVDIVRISYSVGGDVPTSATYYSPPGNISVVTQTRQTRTLTYTNGVPQSPTPWINQATTTSRIRAEWAIPNIIITNGEPKADVYMQTAENTWTAQPVSDLIVDKSYTAYSNILSIDIPDSSDLETYYGKTSYSESVPTEVSSSISFVESGTSGGGGGIELFGDMTVINEVKTVIQQRYVITRTDYPVKVEANQRVYLSTKERTAFEQCQRAMVYGDSVFLSGSTANNYRSRVWWSAKENPTYFPDLNYIEAGSNDTKIAGMMKVGEYLGIVKQGQSYDSTIYLAYPTKIATGSVQNGDTTETTYDDTFSVKSSIGGIGAVSPGAFNILNDEPLFLSRNGVMGINPANENEKQLRNRSFYINKRLAEEGNLENAFSFVWRNLYILAVNNHCYLLDGSQKSSWANEKTNLQYECYYWDNVPAQCFAKYNDELWFTDKKGRLCRFKPEFHPDSYHDDYDPNIVAADDTSKDIIPVSALCSNEDVKIEINPQTWWTQMPKTGRYYFTYGSAGYLHRTMLAHTLYDRDGNPTWGNRFGNAGHLDSEGETILPQLHNTEGWHLNGEPVSLATYGITVTGKPMINDTIMVCVGNPIIAKWSTVFDDDGSAHYFKTMQKKGSMVSLLPQSSTGVKVYLKKDNNAEKFVGTATVRSSTNEITAPSDFYLNKKMKKYKRLQIITVNDGYDETFGLDEIIKCYTLGNYSRNR